VAFFPLFQALPGAITVQVTNCLTASAASEDAPEGHDKGGIESDRLFAQSRQIRAYRGEGRVSFGRAETARDLLLELGHAQVAFGLVIVEGHAQVRDKPQDLIAVGAQAHNPVTVRYSVTSRRTTRSMT
jgi:hypothetical protein